MKKEVILICIDGMREDGFLQCGNPKVQEQTKRGAYTVNGRSVVPSVTLPAHMAMFHSVPPEGHGITTNIHMPRVFMDPEFTPGEVLENVCIMVICPTVTHVMGVEPESEWEGRSVAK